MWGVMLLLVILSVLATRRLREVPGTLQTLLEMALGKLDDFFSGLMPKEKSDRYFPFFATLFIFIIVCNFTGLLPGAGVIPGFKAPTSSLSVTAGLGLTVFLAVIILGIRSLGVARWLRHFIKPVVIMLPFIIVDELVRPVSLALRLYGNIFGEESVMEQLYALLPIGAPLIMMVMSLLFCTIQAVVFSMLAAIYVDESTTLEH